MNRQRGRFTELPQFRLETVLTLVFFVLVLATFVSYFLWRERYPNVFIGCGVAALAVRATSYLIRLIKR